MTRATHIQPTATTGRPQRLGYIHHYQILQCSVFGVQCSIFSPRTHQSVPQNNWHIYHSDHLGSSAFLTDASGTPTQHLQYLPFGEPFIEQRSVTEYYTPYTFSAKERDLETGYSYFGARYYDAGLSVWLSVDPMAVRYPNISDYMYVGGHPTMITDHDGRDWIQDEGGNYVYDKNITSKTKLKDGQRYLGKSAKINVRDSDGKVAYHYNLNEDGSFNDSRGNHYESGSGTFDPNFKSGNLIKSPSISERTGELFSQYNIGYLSDNRSSSELPTPESPITTTSTTTNIVVGYISLITRNPYLALITIYCNAAGEHHYLRSEKLNRNYQQNGNGMGMYVANITGPGVPVPRAAMFSAYNGAFIGWHHTTIKGAPEMQHYEFQRLLRRTRQL
jgi:RHS repeat-associated protein